MRLLIARLSKKDIEGERDSSLVVRLDQAEVKEISSLLVKEIKSGMRTVHGIKFLIEMYDKIDQGLGAIADMKTSASLRHDKTAQHMTWRYRP